MKCFYNLGTSFNSHLYQAITCGKIFFRSFYRPICIRPASVLATTLRCLNVVIAKKSNFSFETNGKSTVTGIPVINLEYFLAFPFTLAYSLDCILFKQCLDMIKLCSKSPHPSNKPCSECKYAQPRGMLV